MKTVSIQEAREDLARLLEEAAKGQPFVVTREGKPSLKVTVEVIDEILLQDKPVDTAHAD
ncbi:type II toxin-antitoxin system prevent-host-death family antitoxin [Neorhizobium sp. JUb45]|uniref:type II toxin-antitoxin system Phd/YefM family antitoxin n=1 Tax=unclassified Neorhizobium TaxID=2629175 RepID=UPI0010D22B70|nr:type II toxin-antitoxin system prevent-host-death family antitoxin [Neorhizobium sp. JUb45]TCR02032.1 prevent-host-death family protein [Neorhizobium sp. JUb45]